MEWFICGVLARMHKIKSVIRLGIVRYPWNPFWHWLVYGYLNHGFVVNAHSIRNGLIKFPFIRSDKVKVIYNGVKQQEIASIREDHDRFIISTAGKLTTRKGVHHLIKSLTHIPEELRSRILIKVVGSGPSESELKKLAGTLKVNSNVEFHGFQKNPSRITSHSDLFVLLSSNEGISNAILEAMTFKIPVLTTSVGGHLEFLQDGKNAYLVSSRRPGIVAEKLVEIMGDEKLSQIGERGYETVKKNFSLERMGKELETFLQEVADRY